METKYCYSDFINDCTKLSENSQNLINFKWDLYEVKKKKDFILNTLNYKYLKSNTYVECENKISLMIEFNIIYSEVYQMPTMYFIITNLNSNKVLTFEEYLDLNKSDNVSFKFSNKNFEISKTVKYLFTKNHPYNGMVYNFMYLCRFNHLLKQILQSEEKNDNKCKNVLFLWLSLIIQYFNLDIFTDFIYTTGN